jgi:hypothetical protein
MDFFAMQDARQRIGETIAPGPPGLATSATLHACRLRLAARCPSTAFA